MAASGLGYSISFLFYIIQALAFYAMGRKARVSYSWLAFIPILQIFVLLAIIRRSAWNVLWLLIPVVNVIFGIIWYVRLFRAFGQNPWLLLLLIIPGIGELVLFVMLLYMGFSSAQYQAYNL